MGRPDFTPQQLAELNKIFGERKTRRIDYSGSKAAPEPILPSPPLSPEDRLLSMPEAAQLQEKGYDRGQTLDALTRQMMFPDKDIVSSMPDNRYRAPEINPTLLPGDTPTYTTLTGDVLTKDDADLDKWTAWRKEPENREALFRMKTGKSSAQYEKELKDDLRREVAGILDRANSRIGETEKRAADAVGGGLVGTLAKAQIYGMPKMAKGGKDADLAVMAKRILGQLDSKTKKDRDEDDTSSGLWRGIKNNLTAEDFLSVGYSSILENLLETETLDKAGKGETLTDTEQDVIRLKQLENKVNDYLALRGGKTTGASVGESVAASAPFMAQFGLTSGVGSLPSVGRTVAGKLLQAGVKKGLAKGVGAVARMGAEAGKMLPLQAAPYNNYLERTAEQYRVGGDGAVSKFATPAFSRAYKGLADAYVDVFTEKTGEGFGVLFHSLVGKPVARLAKNMGVAQYMKRIPRGGVLDGLRRRLAYNGPVGEFAEEMEGNLLAPLLTGEHERWKEGFSAENVWTTFLTTSVMWGGFKTLEIPHMADYTVRSAKLHGAEKKALAGIRNPELKTAVFAAMRQPTIATQSKALSGIDWKADGISGMDAAHAVDYARFRTERTILDGATRGIAQAEKIDNIQKEVQQFQYRGEDGQAPSGEFVAAQGQDGNTYIVLSGGLSAETLDDNLFVWDEGAQQPRQISRAEIQEVQRIPINEFVADQYRQEDEAQEAERQAGQAAEDIRTATEAGIPPQEAGRIVMPEAEQPVPGETAEPASEITGEPEPLPIPEAEQPGVLDRKQDAGTELGPVPLQDVEPEAQQYTNEDGIVLADGRRGIVVAREADGYIVEMDGGTFEKVPYNGVAGRIGEQEAAPVPVAPEEPERPTAAAPATELGPEAEPPAQAAEILTNIPAAVPQIELPPAAGKAPQPVRKRRLKVRKKQVSPYVAKAAALGDIVSIEDVILRDIAGGLRFAWDNTGSKRGLAQELGLTGSEAERRVRIGILSNEGITPEKYAEQLYIEYGAGNEDGIGIRWNLDDGQIKDAVLEILSRITSPKKAYEAAAKLHERGRNPGADYTPEELAEVERHEAALRAAAESLLNDAGFMELYGETTRDEWREIDNLFAEGSTTFAENANFEPLAEQSEAAVDQFNTILSDENKANTADQPDRPAKTAVGEDYRHAGGGQRSDAVSDNSPQQGEPEAGTSAVRHDGGGLEPVRSDFTDAERKVADEAAGGNLFDVSRDLSGQNIGNILEPLRAEITKVEAEIDALESAKQKAVDDAVAAHRVQQKIPFEGRTQDPEKAKIDEVGKSSEESAAVETEGDGTAAVSAPSNPARLLDGLENDVPLEMAQRAFYLTSHVPEKRGTAVVNEYAEFIRGVYDAVLPKAETEQQRAAFAEAFAWFRDKSRRLYSDWLGAHSRVASPMITGPARFPVERNNKRMETEHKRLTELAEWQKIAQKKIEARLDAARTPEQKAAARQAEVEKEYQQYYRHAVGSFGDKVFDVRNNSLIKAAYVRDIQRLAKSDVEAAIRLVAAVNEAAEKYGGKPVLTPRNRIHTELENMRVRRSEAKSVGGVMFAPVAKIKHTKTGADLYAVKLADRVNVDMFDLLRQRAKANKGYYSKFSRAFLFEKAEDAEAFRVEYTPREGSNKEPQIVTAPETEQSEEAITEVEEKPKKSEAAHGIETTISDSPQQPQTNKTEKSVPEAVTGIQKQARKKDTRHAGKIDDFGAKIGGARKDLAAAYMERISRTDEDTIKAKPLSQVFPQPDYARLVESGALSEANAVYLKFLYGAIPAKPRQRYMLKYWAEKVRKAVDTFNEVLTDNPAGDLLGDFARKMRVKGETGHAEQAEMFPEIARAMGFPQEDFSLGAYKIAHYQDGYYVLKGHYTVGIFDTLEQAASSLRKRPEKEPVVRYKVALALYRDTRTKEIFIGKKVPGKNPVKLQGNFTNAKEASVYLKEHRAELEALWEKISTVPQERRTTNRPRVGTDWRHGENVTPERFSETFGFRGVEFGNWVNNTERQTALNEAYDALMDLSALVGKSSRALSLGGELGLAFGARGGVVRTGIIAAAHYEPDKVVINLTKTKGAGSLAHEWFHALDNYFSRKRGYKLDYMTDRPRRLREYQDKVDDTRQEIIDAFDGLMKAIVSSDYFTRSGKLDRVRSKDYWSNNTELGARAFENYVLEKQDENNEVNDYLANYKTLDEWVKQSGGDMETYPYPKADEGAVFAEKFAQLFDAIQEKVDEAGNAVLFRDKREKSEVPFSTGLMVIDTRNEYTEHTQTKNRRFMFAPESGVLILGDESKGIEKGSHAEEFYDANAPGNFDDYVRGWIGFGRSYNNGIIHFSPPIQSSNLNTGFETLYMFAGQGITEKAVVRGFDKGEVPIGRIIPGRFSIAKNNEPGFREAVTDDREAESRETVEAAAVAVAGALHTPVEIVSREEIDADTPGAARKRNAKGWYEPETGKIYVVAENHRTAADAEATVLHEVVGHIGLREVLGERFGDFLDRVYMDEDGSLQEPLDRMADTERQRRQKNGQKPLTDVEARRLATEEYLARLAEGNITPGRFARIIGKVRAWLHDVLGIPLRLNDRDIAYMLWLSRHRLTTPRTAAEAVRKAAARRRVRATLYGEGVRFREAFGPEEPGLPQPDDYKFAEDYIREITKYRKKPPRPVTLTGGRSFVVFDKRNMAERNRLRFLDSTLPVQRLQEEVARRGGRIDDLTDVHKHLNHFTSVAKVAIEKYMDDFINPVLDSIAAIAKSADTDEKTVIDYITAQSSLEREESGIQAFSRDLKKSWTKEKGNRFVSDFLRAYYGSDKMDGKAAQDKAAALGGLWQKIGAANNRMLDVLVEDGMITRETKKRIQGHGWKYYVPLVGFDFAQLDINDELLLSDASAAYDFLNPSRTRFHLNQVVQEAAGRGLKPGNPIAAMIHIGTGAIITAKKNRANQTVLRLARNNPHPDLYRINRIWLMKGPGGEWVETTVEPTAEEVENSKAARRELAELQPLYAALKVQGKEQEAEVIFKKMELADMLNTVMPATVRRQNFGNEAPIDFHEQQQRQVECWVNGVKYVVTLADPAVANAVNNANRLTIPPWVENTVGDATRWLSRAFTSRNPAFVTVNFLRDVQHAALVHAIDRGGNLSGFVRNVTPGMAAITRSVRGKAAPLTVADLKGIDILSNEGRQRLTEQYGAARVYDTLYDYFRENGGETGFVHGKSVEEAERDVRRYVAYRTGTVGQLLRNAKRSERPGIALSYAARKTGTKAVAEAFDRASRVAENTSRFATFVASLEQGKTLLRAVADAKDVTVNFNRRGTASRALGMFYVFFNASVQGAAQVARVAWRNRGRFGAAVTGLVTTGFLESLLLDFFLAGQDDDRDYVSEYDRRNHLIIPLFGTRGFLKLPLPQGFRAFHGIGVLLHDAYKGKITAEECAREMLSTLYEDFSPLAAPSGNNFARVVVPTAATPFYDIAVGRDTFGYPVGKRTFDDAPNYPLSEMGLKNVNRAILALCRGLNALGGGDRDTPAGLRAGGEIDPVLRGLFEWNPSHVEHVLTYYGGGMGKFAKDVVHTTQSLLDTDMELNTYDLPIINRLYGTARRENPASRFYDLRERMNNLAALYKRKGEAVDRNNPEVRRDMERIALFKEYNKAVTRIRKVLSGTNPGVPEYERLQDELDRMMKEYLTKDGLYDTGN